MSADLPNLPYKSSRRFCIDSLVSTTSHDSATMSYQFSHHFLTCWFSPPCQMISQTCHTVDGRNPAPVFRWFIPLFIGFQPSKVVQDFFHPPYQCHFPRCVARFSFRFSLRREAFTASTHVPSTVPSEQPTSRTGRLKGNCLKILRENNGNMHHLLYVYSIYVYLYMYIYIYLFFYLFISGKLCMYIFNGSYYHLWC